MNKPSMLKIAAAALVWGLGTTAALAQDTTASVVASQAANMPKGFAGPAFQVPTGSGSGWGSIGVGVYAQTIDNANDDYDGSMGLNFGLGNPAKYVGLDVSLGLSSLAGNRGGPGGFGEDGSFSAKLHTNLPGLTSFAIGVQSVGRFGALKAPGVGKSSVYTAVSKFFPLGTQGISATVGVGDTAFAVNNGLGAFGSLAYYVTPQISLIGEYTGRFANAAISVAPFKRLPFSLTVGGVNLNDRGGNAGPGSQVAVSAGYGISF